MIDYDTYIFSIKDWFMSILLWMVLCAVPSYFFYRSYIAFGIFLLLYPGFFFFFRKNKKEKRRQAVSVQFLEMIRCFSVNLQTGSNLENAFRKTVCDVEQELGEKAILTKELQHITKGMDNNKGLDGMLMEFAGRTGIGAIEEFALAFGEGKRSGSDMRELIRVTCEDLTERMDIWQERKTHIASQELELKIMCVVPFGIMAYIGMTNQGYFNCLYHNPAGILIMTVCLLAYVGAVYWGSCLITPKEGI